MTKLNSAIIAFALCGATPLLANLPVSRTTSLQAVNVTASAQTFLGLPGHAEPVFRGQVVSTASNTITVAGTVPAISPNSAIAMVVTGVNRGRYFTIVSATSSSVTLSGFSSSGVSLDASDQLEVIPLWTLGTLPISNLTNGEEGDPTSGDRVLVVSATGLATTYYLAETSWLNVAGDVPSNSAVVPFGAAVLFIPATTKQVVVSGVVPPTRVARESGTSTLASVANKFGQSLTLASLQSRVVQGELGDPTSGDRVSLIIAGAVTQVYFADDNQWHRTSDDSVVSAATTIPAGGGFLLLSVDALPLYLD